jgi:multidrug efflux pump subunit AcrA (membrane-fusion protein)
VYVVKDGALVAVPVEVGASDGQRTEIRKGELSPGTQVVLDVAETRP